MKEQRRSQRFQLHLPIQILRVGSRSLETPGETRNLSANGVLFNTELSLNVGDTLEYIITLPSSDGQPASRPMRCLGRVVRVSVGMADVERPNQVAVTLERYEFVRAARNSR